MSKEIEVYNAYFGDCIMLKERDDNSNLLVDFGVHFFQMFQVNMESERI